MALVRYFPCRSSSRRTRRLRLSSNADGTRQIEVELRRRCSAVRVGRHSRGRIERREVAEDRRKLLDQCFPCSVIKQALEFLASSIPDRDTALVKGGQFWQGLRTATNQRAGAPDRASLLTHGEPNLDDAE